jgi:RimJ/RimL family protein N-acetyltransferase
VSAPGQRPRRRSERAGAATAPEEQPRRGATTPRGSDRALGGPTAHWPRAAPLATERLVLEPLRPDHARELAPVLDDPALHAYIGGAPATEEELRARFARQAAGHSPDRTEGWLNWVARDRATSEPIGIVQATIVEDADRARTAALAWVVATSRQGEGLATEGARAAMDWLRERGVRRFTANIHPDHAASAAVARHLGLTPTDERHGGEVRWIG